VNLRWPNLTSTFINPYMTAAHATIAYEVAAELGRSPGTIIIPIGAGPMLVGIVDGLRRLVEAGLIADGTRVIGVQAAGCAPIARAFETGAEKVTAWTEEAVSCARSINDPLVGYASDGTRTLLALRRVGGIAVAVSDAQILSAMYDLASIEGIGCEPAAAAPLAAFRLLEEDRGERLPRPVVLVCSGHALKDTDVELPIQSVKVQHDADARELLALISANGERAASYGERRGSAVRG
jgi:threonine synthase